MAAPLVTGATGFAAAHLIRLLLDGGAAVQAWANPHGKPARQSFGADVRWAAVDLLDAAAVREAIAHSRPSAVYHCAGVADVGASWTNPERALRVNALGTHHLIEAVRAAGLEAPVLVTGSALVYRQSAEPLDESSPIGPTGPYGLSKLAQEMVACRAAPVRVLLARPFNHAGPGQSDAYVTSSFAKQIAEAETGRAAAVLHVGNLESRRDITDVRDTVRAYRALVERGTPSRPYNVCRGEAYRIRDLLDILLGLASVRMEVRTDPARMRPSDNPVVLGNPARIRDETGWIPELPIERTLADLLDYWRARHHSPL